METYPSLPIQLPVDEDPKNYRILSNEQSEFGFGETRVVSTLSRRRWKFNHKALSNANIATLETFWATVKASTFSFVNPDDANETVSVRFISRGVIEMAQLKTIWDVNGVEVQEVLAW